MAAASDAATASAAAAARGRVRFIYFRSWNGGSVPRQSRAGRRPQGERDVTVWRKTGYRRGNRIFSSSTQSSFTVRYRIGEPVANLADVPQTSNATKRVRMIANVEIRPAEFQVLIDERRVGLTVREFELFLLLAERLDAVVQRPEIYALMWGGEMPPPRPLGRRPDPQACARKLEQVGARMALHPHPLRHRLPVQPRADRGARI